MSFIKINDVTLPPTKRGVTVTSFTLTRTNRNANGIIVGQKVGRDQFKIENLEWSWLPAEEWENILQQITSELVSVTFVNPKTNSPVTINMLCSEQSGQPYWINDNGEPTHYRSCKLKLTDIGE